MRGTSASRSRSPTTSSITAGTRPRPGSGFASGDREICDRAGPLGGGVVMKVAVYPGTFDPITLGHLDIIRRGAHLVDKLVIGVTTNPSKEPMFTVSERLAMVRREV